MDLSFSAVDEDARTLAQWIEVRNVGDTLTDLSLRLVSPHDQDVRLEPAVANAHLAAGDAIVIVATPVLYLEFDNLTAEIEATAAGESERHAITFQAPPGVRLMAARSHSSEATSTNMSWCAPEKCTDVPAPGGLGPNPGGTDNQTPTSGQCEADPKCGECWAKLQDFIELRRAVADAIDKLHWRIMHRPSGLRRDISRGAIWQVIGDLQYLHNRELPQRWEQFKQERGCADCNIDQALTGTYMPPAAAPELGPKAPAAQQLMDERAGELDLDTRRRSRNCKAVATWIPLPRGIKDRVEYLCGGKSNRLQDTAEAYRRLKSDPPSEDFLEIVTPAKEIAFAEESLEEESELEKSGLAAIEAQGWVAAYINAYTDSYERYQGAQAAGSFDAARRQAEAMATYADRALHASRKSYEQWSIFEESLIEIIDAIYTDIGDDEHAWVSAIKHWQQNIGEGAIPRGLRGVFEGERIAAEQLARLREAFLEIDPVEVANALFEIRRRLEAYRIVRETFQSRQLSFNLTDAHEEGILWNLRVYSEELYQQLHHDEEDTRARAPAPGASFALREALQRRAGFSRVHRGPFAAQTDGDLDTSAAQAAGYHAGDRVVFAWHRDTDQVVFAAVDPLGAMVMDPEAIGIGRWPRVTAGGDSTAVAWETDHGFAVRIHDGADWGEEIALSGREAALRFAADGAFHAATTAGLWRLDGDAFEQVWDGGYVQPALAIDSAGEPHVAWVSDGRIHVEGEAVVDGEHPSLIFAPDGTLHLAYLADGTLFVRQRQEGEWSDAEEIPAENPRWPTLALGAGDEVRVSYVGDAEIGPPALWLVRLPDTEPILMPSLAGNVTDAWFTLSIDLRYPRSHYRPMDILVTFNDVWAQHFHQSVPEGRYLVRLDPRHVFTSSGRPAWNRIGVHRWYGNAGANLMWADYKLTVRRAWSEYYGYASSAQEVVAAHEATHRINHGQADLALLANAMDLPIEPPTGPIELPITVANLGEAESRPAELAMLGDGEELQRVEIPVLHRDEQVVINLQVDGRLERASFRIAYEPGYSDFDPSNDELSLHLWSQRDYDEVEPLRPERLPAEPEAIVATYPNDLYPPWIAGALPAGATAIGDWEWSHFPAFEAVPSHASPREEGRSLHYFIRADDSLPLAAGDNLIQYVYLDPDAPPEQIMLRAFLDGRHEGRALYWGGDEDLIRAGDDGAEPAGDLPEPGRWVRLKIPIEELGIESAWIDGLVFGHYDGRVYWGPTAKSVERLDDSPRVMILARD
jgi:hypothetical protein